MLNQPISSPMMKMMLGFPCCCRTGDDCPTTVNRASNGMPAHKNFLRRFMMIVPFQFCYGIKRSRVWTLADFLEFESESKQRALHCCIEQEVVFVVIHLQ